MDYAAKQELIQYLKLVRSNIDKSINYSEKLVWKKTEMAVMRKLNEIEEDWYLELNE